MKFIKKWREYLKEGLENTKKLELYNKREEIKNKISQIESELNLLPKSEVEPTVETVDVVVNTTIDITKSQELELSLESLKKELADLELL